MATTIALREALNLGISSGNFIDTKIILYSRRDSSGRVCRPRALYANSHVLKKVPHFQDSLFGDFSESQSRDFTDPIDEEESTEDYGYFSDSDLENDEDEVVSSFNNTSESNANQRGPLTIPGDGNFCEYQEEYPEKGKVLKILDMAFVTFQAFLMYLYTDAIEFAPFGSEENRRSRRPEIINPSDDKVPRPSPKSIYRLADKYDVPALKNLAFNHIHGQLANCDIVEESFSRFASRYDEIRNIYARCLVRLWVENPASEAIRTGIEKKITSFAEGVLEHATAVLTEVWEIVSKDGDIITPENTSSTPATKAPSPAHWASVKMALIKSIRRGIFFDKKYWARHYSAGEIFKPVYFSSTIMNDETERMNKLVTRSNSRNPFTSDPEGDANVESDCEGAEGELLITGEENVGQVRAVLRTGSFSAWTSLFFYRCTDEISFAPLRSQGVDVRLNYIRENTVAAAPHPCSPKSIFILANLLEISLLRERALADIKSKVTADNVVGEAFSWVAADHKDIMEMQCDLLISNLKNEKTIALVKESIRRISDGSSSHCAGALNLVFEKAVRSKKETKGVKLRCNYPGCMWNTRPVAYSSVEGSTYYCHFGCPLQCIGCGSNRTGNYSSCQGCGIKFI